jgi:hypothetical protein
MKYIQPFGIVEGEAPYVNGNPAIGLNGSIPPADCMEPKLREIVNALNYSAMLPDDTDLEQFTKAIRSQRINYVVDTGTVNNLKVVCNPPATILTPGFPLRVLVKFDNTGPSLITVNSIGPIAIRRANNANLAAEDILAGEVVELVFDGTAFQIANYLGFTATVKNNNFYNFNIPYAVDIGTENAIRANFSPAITVLHAGDLIEIKIAVNNSGACTVQCNSMPAQQLKTPTPTGLQQLSQNQVVTGMHALMVYDGTAFQIITTAIPKPGSAPPTPGEGIQIAKRAFYQDQNFHAVTQKGVFTEAFRVSYAPVSVGNTVRVEMVGTINATHPDDEYATFAYMAYSTDNGGTWNPPDWPGISLPASMHEGQVVFIQEPRVGSFTANIGITRLTSTWMSVQGPGLLRDSNFRFAIVGEMTVPAGPPANILFRLVFAAKGVYPPTRGSPNIPRDPLTNQAIRGGTIIDVIEYTRIMA